MDDELPIQLEGRPVRVFASLIEQAHEYLSQRGGEFVTFVVVGSHAVSLYTGRPSRRMITHDVPPPEVSLPTEARGGRTSKPRTAPRTAPPKKATAKRGPRTATRPASYIDINALQLLDFFTEDREREYSAWEVGTAMGLESRDAAKRQTLSRMIAELRVSGLIRATSDSRVPDYQFVKDLPDVELADARMMPETVMDLMRNIGHPLAVGIMGDLFQISRHDRTKRFAFSRLLTEMVDDGRLTVSTDERLKIPVYALAT